jgi:hypothetical protein
MEELDIAWAAGLYEGEGWCELTYSTTVPEAARRARICVGSTDRDVLAKLEKIFGGTVIDKNRGADALPHWKQAWTWRLASIADVVDAIKRMWPYLASRRRGQLQPILDAYALMPPPGTSGQTHCKNGHALTSDNLVPRTENGRSYPRCKVCVQANSARHYERMKAKRAALSGR